MKYRIIHQQGFSIERMEKTLNQQIPGNYKFVFHTKNEEYSALVRWDGKDWHDLKKEQ